MISLKRSRERLISQLKENSSPWQGRKAGSRKELLPIMSNSHRKKYESVQEPERCYQYRNWLSCPLSIVVHTAERFPCRRDGPLSVHPAPSAERSLSQQVSEASPVHKSFENLHLHSKPISNPARSVLVMWKDRAGSLRCWQQC